MRPHRPRPLGLLNGRTPTMHRSSQTHTRRPPPAAHRQTELDAAPDSPTPTPPVEPPPSPIPEVSPPTPTPPTQSFTCDGVQSGGFCCSVRVLEQIARADESPRKRAFVTNQGISIKRTMRHGMHPYPDENVAPGSRRRSKMLRQSSTETSVCVVLVR